MCCCNIKVSLGSCYLIKWNTIKQVLRVIGALKLSKFSILLRLLASFLFISNFELRYISINILFDDLVFQGGDVVQENIFANVTDDTVSLEFQRSDGTLITQVIDFRNVSKFAKCFFFIIFRKFIFKS